MTNSRYGLCLFILGFTASVWASDPAVSPPFLRVPKCAAKPNLTKDLSIQHGFLQGCGLSGMVDFHTRSHIPWADASWWLTYDNENLYLACLVRTTDTSTGFVSTVTDHDDPRIVFTDDHLEIQISFESRERAGQMPFYKFMINPRGAVYAAIVNWQPGQDRLGWTDTLDVKTHLRTYLGCQWWVTKIAVPLDQLGVKSLDHQRALLQLVHVPAGAQVFAGWVGEPWTAWSKFGEVLFDPGAPAFSLNATFPGNLINSAGRLRLDNRFTAKSGDKSASLETTVRATAEGRELWKKTFAAGPVVGGTTTNLQVQETIPIETKNILSIEMKQRGAAGEELLLYRADMPYHKPDEVIEGKFAAWHKSHLMTKDPATTVDFAYFPSFDKLRVRVKTEIMLGAIPPEKIERAKKIANADRFKATVIGSDHKTYGTVEGSLEKFLGAADITLREPLPAGEHSLRVETLKDGEIVDTAIRSFVREKFPWEHNQIGKEKVVIPPYTPIEVADHALKVWGREYTLADTGFFSQITAEGRPLLSGPITLVSTQEGTEHSLTPAGKATIRRVPGETFPADFLQYWHKPTCPKPKLLATNGYQAIVHAQGELGKLRVEVEGTMEYEGFYRVKLRLVPQGAVACESVDMLVPLASFAELMRFSRNYATVGYGRIPGGEGVLFESTRLPRASEYLNSFVPKIYLGNYSRGLWWMADSDQGWVVDDKQPLAQLERRAGKVFLRLRFVNKPCTLNKPRTIEFALQAVPMKPKPDHYRRIAWKLPEPQFAHDTSGLRYYGSALEGFTLYTDADYEALRHFYYEMDIKKNHVRPYDDDPKKKWWGMRWLEPARKGHPLVEYGSTWMFSPGMKESPTFLGEWTYSNDAGRFLSEEKYRGRWNYSKTYCWTNDADITLATATFNESLQDCFIWHMTRLAEKSHLNGTFYDNYMDSFRLHTKIDTGIAGDAYRRDDGRFQAKSSTFRRHDLTKRLATALWLAGRPPFQLVAWEQDVSFADASWYVEGPWYVWSPSLDYIDMGLTLDKFQATTCKPGQVGYVNTMLTPVIGKDGKRTFKETTQRMVLAYCLFNDIGCILPYLEYPPARAIMDKFAAEVRFFDGARFLPYWEDTDWITGAPEGVLVSGYVHPEKLKAVLVVLNTTENPVRFDVRLDGPKLLGRAIQSVNNLEDGSAAASLEIERHGVKFLLVE